MQHIVVAGGGIGGLAFAALARRLGCVQSVTVIERADDICRANIGSGIGLWPNAMAVLDMLGLAERLAQQGQFMPEPSYRDTNGILLARGTNNFSTKFPVLCLHRDRLQAALVEACLSPTACSQPPVTIVSGVAVQGYARTGGTAEAQLSDGRVLTCDLLVGADGINSAVRAQLLRECGLPASLGAPVPCGYAYFRACVSPPSAASAQGSDWHGISFESWGAGLRFGFVPLQSPQVFWFCAVPTGPGRLLEARPGSHAASDDDRAMLGQLFGAWRGPAGFPAATLGALIASTDTAAILRTDIHKIAAVHALPWSAHGGRVVLLGDSAHATAPNLAQGAGLSIEDAAVLAAKVQQYHVGTMPTPLASPPGRPVRAIRRTWESLVAEYERERRPRAWVVQSLADAVAAAGQLQAAPLVAARNLVMRAATTLVPAVQQRIFEATVSYSLGGTSSHLAWLPPLLSLTDPDATRRIVEHRCLLARVLGPHAWSQLSDPMRRFRSAAVGGRGAGLVTVDRPGGLAGLLGSVAGLPPRMQSAPFSAIVAADPAHTPQRWTRVFNDGGPAAVAFTTTHDTRVIQGRTVLCEGVGGALDRLVQFYYDVSVSEDSAVTYRSRGLLLGGLRLPLPAALLPSSTWVERPTARGWTFDGTISLPLVGPVMRYRGSFHADDETPIPHDGHGATPAVLPPLTATAPLVSGAPGSPPPRAIVAGGAGLLGSVVCQQLRSCGWDVHVLSRSGDAHGQSKGQVTAWDGRTGQGWSQLLQPNCIIINLAGENPGKAAWTPAFQERILTSRLDSIAAIADAIMLARPACKPAAVLQASAVGIYGSRGDEWLSDVPGPTEAESSHALPSSASLSTADEPIPFRVSCCRAIETCARDQFATHGVAVSILRIGHVLSRRGGLLPHLDLASRMRAGRLGSGAQYVPWVHETDLARMVATLAAGTLAAGGTSSSATNAMRRADVDPSSGSGARDWSGTLHLCAPHPATNSAVMAALARARGRAGCVVPVPAWAMGLLAGPTAAVVLDSERTFPARMVDAGFRFAYPDIGPALDSLYRDT